MARRLKVFRTPIGFHDAYVAAPSQKAALEAWGSTANLFARGVAEEVTDTKLTEAPLADPGAIVRVARGSTNEHMAALPKPKPAFKRASKTADPPKAKSSAPSRPRKPRPSRGDLADAEDALEEAEADFARQHAALAKREAALAADREKLDRARAARLAKLERNRDVERNRYDAAMQAWSAQD